jgi:thiosulfate/3-mercaptopyruvate sulfurtransferase
VEQAVGVFSRLGIGRGVQVVTYDSVGGTLAAARLWWMLRWLGHNRCAVLDGGWQRWLAEDRPLTNGVENRLPKNFKPVVHPEMVVTADQVEAMRLNAAYRVLDARAYQRYLGNNETIDPVAGHIPGALSAPDRDNLQPDLTFKPIAELRRRYQDLLGTVPAGRCAVYCGSGVTATHDILAMLHAGLGEARLYPGSWSEWITNPNRPVSTDDQA